MNALAHAVPPASDALLSALAAQQFSPAGDTFARGPVSCRVSQRWLTLTADSLPGTTNQAPAGIGYPGLWSTTGNGAGLVFEFPLFTLHGGAEPAEDADQVLSKALAWAVATAAATLPPGWEAPEQALVQSWLPPEAFTLRRGRFVRQGEMLLAKSRWTLRMPVLPQLPAQLPAPRESLLAQVLDEARRRWRMVRLGFVSRDTGRALVAETDFSGAPVCEPLFLAGLAAVRSLTAWLVETADLLADTSVRLRSLEFCRNLQPKDKHEEQ